MRRRTQESLLSKEFPAPPGVPIDRLNRPDGLSEAFQAQPQLFHVIMAFMHAVLIVQIDHVASKEQLIEGLTAGFGEANVKDKTAAHELSSLWIPWLLYGLEGPTFYIYCIRNVSARLQFHLEPGGDDIWQTTETTWSQVRRHLKDWKPEFISARIEEGQTTKEIMKGKWRPRLRDIEPRDIALMLVGLAGIGLAASGTASIAVEIPAYISGVVAAIAATRNLLRKKIKWEPS